MRTFVLLFLAYLVAAPSAETPVGPTVTVGPVVASTVGPVVASTVGWTANSTREAQHSSKTPRSITTISQSSGSIYVSPFGGKKVLATPGFPLRYSAGFTKNWDLETLKGYRLQIRAEVTCLGCELNFYYSSFVQELEHRLCHEPVCSFYMDSNMASINFESKTDVGRNRSYFDGGARIAVAAVEGCGCDEAALQLASMDTEAVLTSPGFPKSSPVSCDCTWKILAPPDSDAGLRVHFTSFDLPISSTLRIYDGDTDEEMLRSECRGLSCPDTLTATGTVQIRLTTSGKSSSDMRGFRALVTATGGTGESPADLSTPVYVALCVFIIGMILIVVFAGVTKRRHLSRERLARERRREAREVAEERRATAAAAFTAASASVRFHEAPPPDYEEALEMAKPDDATPSAPPISSNNSLEEASPMALGSSLDRSDAALVPSSSTAQETEESHISDPEQ